MYIYITFNEKLVNIYKKHLVYLQFSQPAHSILSTPESRMKSSTIEHDIFSLIMTLSVKIYINGGKKKYIVFACKPSSLWQIPKKNQE